MIFLVKGKGTHWVKINQDNFKTVNFATIFQSHCEVKNLSSNDFEMDIQALKYRSVTDIVRPIREIVRRREETTGHSVRAK